MLSIVSFLTESNALSVFDFSSLGPDSAACYSSPGSFPCCAIIIICYICGSYPHIYMVIMNSWSLVSGRLLMTSCMTTCIV